tara:strand:+ start:389 stop:664 length:276 start_codon:yes stop_codon:yes gene_type:complete
MTESDFSLKREECPKCGAVWLNGEHRWKTGAGGSELDLAGLVCNGLQEEKELCINPSRGMTGGDTWEYRRGYIEGALDTELKHAKRNSEQN